MHLASCLHQALGGTLGATAQPLPPAETLALLSRGRVELADGSVVNGFICEPIGIAGARDITAFGVWRVWLAAASSGGV